MLSPTHAEPVILTGDGLDSYAKRGVAISRDAASVVIAALGRDAFEMDRRGGEPNREAAHLNRELAKSIGKSLMTGYTP